ncbi:uncharacterized protein LOC116207724 isoform X1 [Punica granatum]|uniref:Uncharacterized protein LOC116207724 isoform X1 n=1 Tax=Punica granatum TaxID=22663 RepID=A0A6P8DK08_PUNGR|nr:uncharacterized protein LOC116207724 isoform X1 [Punica granatum]XP_031396661.1 uncharacterized protein LOC116207724 isoform X1 [Punica granatum]
MSQGFWMPKGGGDSNDGEMAYDSTSRVEAKRSHQWFMDGSESDLLPSKKQALELTSNNSFLELLNSNPSQWGAASGFQTASGHLGEQLFDAESARMVNYDERGIPSIGAGKMNMAMGRKIHEDLLLSDSSFGLSMSHVSEDPASGLNYGGARKVKVSQVKGPEHVIPVSMGHGYNKMESNHLFMPHAFVRNDENPISLALPSGLGAGDDSIISLGNTNGGDNSGISMGKPHGVEDESASIGQTYREDENSVSIGHVIGKECNNIMSIGQGYQSDGCTMSMNHMYNKEGNSSSVSVGNSYEKSENIMSHSFGKGQSTIISFGGGDDDTNSSSRLVYNYEMLMGQASLQMPDAIGNMGLVGSNGDAQVILSGAGSNSKKKEEHNINKKSPSNNFPSNVRSLLSTGILDGVHVKYIAWSREKELRGIIRGCGYLCGCASCNYTKVINAYEFERHAGCKTKHPNNHIYFENGKTIYGTVQELRSTPQHMLFEVMQTITGSPINQKSFRLWKESYLAATRELQRIYGKDDGKVLS